EQPLNRARLQAHLAAGGILERNPGSRFAHRFHPGGESTLFIDGQEWLLGPEQASLAPLLCRQYRFPPQQLAEMLEQAPELLLDLVNEGYLVMPDDG
ncbi:MAG: winged helix domain-containing protein, partial [Candidatus Competibacteraceae bacterium]|nr:winged helix domain-containing protein [Candidatus Competibacteraceae bacterium]